MIVNSVLHDIRFGLRTLAKHRTLTGIAVISLAIALASNTIGLSLCNKLLLKVSSARDPEQLAAVYTREPAGDPYLSVSYPDYLYYRDNNQVFTDLIAFPYSVIGVGLNYGGRNEMVMANLVSGNYFDMLGVRPAMGRGFLREEDEKKTPVVVLNYSFWERLGADPSIIGQTVALNQNRYTVIGIAPKQFSGAIFGLSPDVWIPIGRQPDVIRQPEGLLLNREDRWLSLIGRLKPGVTIEQAQANLSILSQQLAQAYPKSNKDRSAVVIPATPTPASLRSIATLFSGLFLAIVFLVLLIACGNVALLLLGLGSARRNEMLIRASLGATRGRLVRQLVVESLLIALMGGLLGYGLAAWGLIYLSTQKISAGLPLPLVLDFSPDLRVFFSTLALMVIVGIGSGLVPAWRSSSLSLNTITRGEGDVRIGKLRLQRLLVVLQTSLCVVILVTAGLALRSVENQRRSDYGFGARNLAVATLDFTLNNYPREKVRDFTRQAVSAVSKIPGVQSVSLALGLPLGGSAWDSDQVIIPGYEKSSQERTEVAYSVIDENYFPTLGISLLAGRNFDARDVEKAQEVVIINKQMAERFWPNQNPVGQRFRIVNGNREVEVAGMVADGKYSDLDEQPRSFMYFCLHQHDPQFVSLIARTAGPPQRLLPGLTQALSRQDDRFVFETKTLDDAIRISLALPIVTLSVLSVFGGLALLLAMVGLYAVVAHSVNQRQHEVGIRIALGAHPRMVAWLMVRQGVSLVLIGVVAGLAASCALATVLSSFFYQIQTLDPLVLVSVTAMVLLVAFAASYAAVRRWTRIDPMRLLRHS